MRHCHFKKLTCDIRTPHQGPHYEQFYVKYNGLKRGYINYSFMSFSDLELSFWFKLRYFKAVLCKM